MSIIMRKSTMVRPSKDTPRGSIWLSDVDLIKRTPYTHTPFVNIYSNSDRNLNSSSSKYFDSEILISSLSQILVPFYPIAGRLRINDKNGRIEIDCNAKGVLFVEIETSYEISDFGDFVPNDMLRKLVIPACDYSGGLAKIPLYMAQVTRFRCGGVAIGLGIHHYAGDGAAYAYMTCQWARLASGLGLAVLPVFDRTGLLVPRNPPQVEFDHPEFQPRPSVADGSVFSDSKITEDTKVGLFKFTKDQINVLKQQTMSKSKGTKYTTFEVLSAHIWRCSLKARGVQNDTLVRFSTPINGRSKFKQVPKGYFGNFIFNSVYIGKSGDILSRPLWYAASKIRETVTKVDENYIMSAVDFLSLRSDPTVLATGSHTSRCPDIHLNFWKAIPFFEADFGWGKPVVARHGGIGYEGQVFIMPDRNGDDLFVGINLFVSHMDHFEKIIYDFDDRRAAL
ncbi:hypothetical protein RND81_02G231400 [Saponaria officinalis]|uniref:Shikimate O-hydroxycinnamoyltransferase n=1 Tax=Saponaria officinalis TaxID=3572 RepID=A0AAW1MX93_SAPOF